MGFGPWSWVFGLRPEPETRDLGPFAGSGRRLRRCRCAFRRDFRRWLFGLAEDLAFKYPCLYADHAVSRLCFGEAVVDIGTEGMQRDTALAVPLGARDLCAVQAAGNANLDAKRANAH